MPRWTDMPRAVMPTAPAKSTALMEPIMPGMYDYNPPNVAAASTDLPELPIITIFHLLRAIALLLLCLILSYGTTDLRLAVGIPALWFIVFDILRLFGRLRQFWHYFAAFFLVTFILVSVYSDLFHHHIILKSLDIAFGRDPDDPDTFCSGFADFLWEVEDWWDTNGSAVISTVHWWAAFILWAAIFGTLGIFALVALIFTTMEKREKIRLEKERLASLVESPIKEKIPWPSPPWKLPPKPEPAYPFERRLRDYGEVRRFYRGLDIPTHPIFEEPRQRRYNFA